MTFGSPGINVNLEGVPEGSDGFLFSNAHIPLPLGERHLPLEERLTVSIFGSMPKSFLKAMKTSLHSRDSRSINRSGT